MLPFSCFLPYDNTRTRQVELRNMDAAYGSIQLVRPFLLRYPTYLFVFAMSARDVAYILVALPNFKHPAHRSHKRVRQVRIVQKSIRVHSNLRDSATSYEAPSAIFLLLEVG
jgi:hypothetical protein